MSAVTGAGIAFACFVGAVGGIVLYRWCYLAWRPPVGIRLLEFIKQTVMEDGTLQEFRAIVSGAEVEVVLIDCGISEKSVASLPLEVVAFDVMKRDDGVYLARGVLISKIARR